MVNQLRYYLLPKSSLPFANTASKSRQKATGCVLFLTVLKKLRSVGKKLNKKDLLSTNLATKHGYCTQRNANMRSGAL